MLRLGCVVLVGTLLAACGGSKEAKKKPQSKNPGDTLTAAGVCNAVCDKFEACFPDEHEQSCYDDCLADNSDLGSAFGSACSTAYLEFYDCVGGLTCAQLDSDSDTTCLSAEEDFAYACATSNCRAVAEKMLSCDTVPQLTSALDYMFATSDGLPWLTYCGFIPLETPCDSAYDTLYACLAGSSCADIDDFLEDDASTVCAAEWDAIISACSA